MSLRFPLNTYARKVLQSVPTHVSDVDQSSNTLTILLLVLLLLLLFCIFLIYQEIILSFEILI